MNPRAVANGISALVAVAALALPAVAQAPSLGPVTISLGAHFGCGLDASGEVRCWGDCRKGQCGSAIDRAGTPQAVPGLAEVTQVAVGYSFACALRRDGQVLCWGDNAYFQLGTELPEERARPAPVPGLSEITAIALGSFHACALRRDGAVLCWGGNTYANLGTPRPEDRRATPAPVHGVRGITGLWAGSYHTCARGRRGQLSCWGGSSYGQSGTRRRVRRAPRTRLRDSRAAETVELGGNMGCFSTASGAMRCWGSNLFNVGPGEYWSTPQTLETITQVQSIGVAGQNLCAVSGGRVFCWGVNHFVHLGVPTEERGNIVSDPTAVPGIDDAVEVELGKFVQCAKRSTGAWVCWGYNARGGVGVGSSDRLVLRPTPLPW